MKSSKSLPLVYSCSGCSSAAQLANRLAIGLDRQGAAEMSCIAGVGGDVPSLVKTATSGRPVIALDGCVLGCVRSCLARHGVQPAAYFLLSDMGVRKKYHQEFDEEDASRIMPKLVEAAASLATVAAWSADGGGFAPRAIR
jgi:uncharacterized metal-binding protein